jgi:UDP-N-acetylglucosamine--N-acetylmuramyl-(pentapeptide) pyrophosphoryl-undecaprenol N-acetylglucosamine transferase
MMAGGTGGHVFPALAVARALSARGHAVSWIGTAAGLEARVVPAQGFELDVIGVQGLRGSGVLRLIKAPWVVGRAMWQALGILRRRRPDLVIGVGGFVTGPGGVVARLLGLPLVIHEQNAVPGMTNRWLARIATRVLAAFPGAFPERVGVVVTGNPVRAEIAAIAAPQERFAQREERLHLLIMGGSLGAQALNEMLPEALAMMDPEARPLVRHQAGRGKTEAARAAYQAAGVDAEVTEFIGDVAQALAWADVAICRAGALTVSELAAAGLGAILVPYPYAVDDHQTANARVLADADAAVVVQQRELAPQWLADWLQRHDRDALLEMAKRARACALPDATERVVRICEEVMA